MQVRSILPIGFRRLYGFSCFVVLVDEIETCTMQDRRIEPRHRTDACGSIAIDEHTAIACLIHDLSVGGVRITLPDTSLVPETFLLSVPFLQEPKVCTIVWRADEMIGARFR